MGQSKLRFLQSEKFSFPLGPVSVKVGGSIWDLRLIGCGQDISDTEIAAPALGWNGDDLCNMDTESSQAWSGNRLA